jgi:hypothetical protein
MGGGAGKIEDGGGGKIEDGGEGYVLVMVKSVTKIGIASRDVDYAMTTLGIRNSENSPRILSIGK